MLVGTPTVDAHGVKSYPVTSVFQGPQPTVARVLEPTSPAPGKLHRHLYVLPVETGVTSQSSTYSDGLEELRLLDIHNRYNLTLIAPSFLIEPWYGDHANRRLTLAGEFHCQGSGSIRGQFPGGDRNPAAVGARIQ